MIAFMESMVFEEDIRNAISLGGDSDTLAVITGSIAELPRDSGGLFVPAENFSGPWFRNSFII